MHWESLRFYQASGNDDSIQADIRDAKKISTIKPISGPMETTIHAINLADTVISQFDTVAPTYLRPFSIFNTVVKNIANDCPLLADNLYLV